MALKSEEVKFMKKVKFNPGFLSGVTLAIDDDFVKFTGFQGGQVGSIPKKSIKSVTIEPGKKAGDAALKFVGEGTSLGSFSTAIKYAEKCQRWLVEQLAL
jgi:hypothetical protein